MKQYLLAHDLGTSGNKATLYTTDGEFAGSEVFSYSLNAGADGSAEQDADDWWRAVCVTTKKLTEGIDPSKIAAISFSGQMMGCLCVDSFGSPLRKALIWADMRSHKQRDEILRQIENKDFYRITGHRISSSYSATKLMWIKENEPEIYAKTHKMLNAKDYIILKLTGRYVTEPSDASSTCLMDLNTLCWSDELLKLCKISGEKLPEIIPSVAVAGAVTREAAGLTGLLQGTPVICGGGDGVCAAVGTGVIREKTANCCLGTSSWISTAAKKPVYDPEMTTFNFAHIVPGYVLPCGTMQTGGGALSWAVKQLFDTADETSKDEIYARVCREASHSKAGAKGLVFLPYLMGERSPRWDDRARGAFLGLSLEHTRGDMLRAVMEGVAYNLDIIRRAFLKSGQSPEEITLIGGGARNGVWRQILSDVLTLPVAVPDRLEEATSMGAAVTAGVGAGVFSDFSVIDRFIKIQNTYTPDPKTQDIYGEMTKLFDRYYYALSGMYTERKNEKND